MKAKSLLNKNGFQKWIGTEDSFQIAMARELDAMGLLWIHVANERKTNRIINKYGQSYSPGGNKLTLKGVKPGVPDILCFEKRHGCSGLALELKSGDNKPNENQQEFLKQLTYKGWLTAWTNSKDEAMKIVNDYLNTKNI